MTRHFFLFSSIGLAAFLCLGCASTTPLLYTKLDPDHQQVTVGVINNRLQDVQSSRGPVEVFFSPQRVFDADGAEHYQFVIQVTHEYSPFMLIKPGGSLWLDVDGKRRVFKSRQGGGPRCVVVNHWGRPSTYSESVIYNNVSKSDVARIVGAQVAHLQLFGFNDHLSGNFSEQNFAAVEAVYEKAVTIDLKQG